MALIDDLFSENVLDEPDDLEQVEEGEVFQEPEVDGDNEDIDDAESENKKTDGQAVDIKKKRKVSLKPRLNILRLMSEKNGLTAIQKVFKDVKLKGKGHERDDLNLIMKKMEIWAHQLYPSMQFDDCLGRLEKLGTTKPVMTYVTKIRMGLEDEVSRTGDIINDEDDSGNEAKPDSSVSDFDRLLNTQNRQQMSSTSNVSSGLSDEQKERMMRNRLIAEQRRLDRMKALKEQEELAKEQDKIKLISKSDAVINEDLPIVFSDKVDDKLSQEPFGSADVHETSLGEVSKINTHSTVEISEDVEMVIDSSPETKLISESDSVINEYSPIINSDKISQEPCNSADVHEICLDEVQNIISPTMKISNGKMENVQMIIDNSSEVTHKKQTDDGEVECQDKPIVSTEL